MKKTISIICFMVLLMIPISVFAIRSNMPVKPPLKVVPPTNNTVEESNTLVSTNTVIDENVESDEEYTAESAEITEKEIEQQNSYTIRNAIKFALKAMVMAVIISGLYLIIETGLIIANKNINSIWNKVINIFIAIGGLPASYGIISIAIAVKLYSDKKSVKIISNIVALLAHLVFLFVLKILFGFSGV